MMKLNWNVVASASRIRAVWVAAAIGVAVVAASPGSEAQVGVKPSSASIQVDCVAAPTVCHRSTIAIEAVDQVRISYLQSVGACGTGAACSKGIRPNSNDPIVFQRIIAFSFDQCVANKCPSTLYPEGSDALAKCVRDNCGSLER